MMRTRAVYAAAGLAVSMFCGAANAKPGELGDVGGVPGAYQAIPGVREFSGQVIVRPLQAQQWALRGVGAEEALRRQELARARLMPWVVKSYPEVDEFVLQAPLPAGRDAAVEPGAAEQALIAELMATGEYEYVTPNWIVYPVGVPNDPLFGNQWQHVNMQSAQAWALLTGTQDILVAVVDTGIDRTHPDIASRVPGFNSASDRAEVDGGDISDINGHGTAVLGSAAARGNNGVGVAGMGWNFRTMMVRATNAAGGGASIDDLVQGARWAIDNGARVVSVSYSGIESPSIGTTGTYIKSRSGLLVWSAGNSNTDLASFDYPDVIIVGATDQQDRKAGFSSYGRAVDVFAPGVGVWTTTNGGGYGGASGTSFSGPIVNGLCGLIWSANPAFTPDQVETILTRFSDDLGTPGEDLYWGWGRVNARRSAAAAVDALNPQPPVVVDDSATALIGSDLLIDALANDFDINGDPLTVTSFNSTSTRGATVQRFAAGPTFPRDRFIYRPQAGITGTDTFTYTLSDGTNQRSATVSVNVFDPATFRAPDQAPPNLTQGVRVDYYVLNAPSVLPNFDTLTPYASDRVNFIDFASTNGDFLTSGRSENVGAVFTGYVTIFRPDFYTFFTESDDGSKLFIGDTLIVNNDGLHGMQERSGTIALQAGTHRIRVEFFERGGGAGLIVRVAGGGLVRQPVPGVMWSTVPLCRAEFTGDGTVDISDFFAFLSAYAANEPRADLDSNGAINVEDFFAYVALYAAGC